MTEVVTKLTVDSAGAVVDLKAFADAMSKASDVTSKSVATMTTGPQSVQAVEKAWSRLQGTTDPIFAAQAKRQGEVEKAFKTANAAVANGFATHEQAAKQVQAVAAKYDALTASAQRNANANTTLGKALSPVNAQLVALSAGAGPVGTFLSALGPWGIAAAVGLGAVAAAFHYVEEESLRMGQRAIDIRQFTDVTGLAINEVAALKKAGAEFGITGDSLSTSFTRLTGQLTEARRASGALYEDVRVVNAGLAKQLAESIDTKGGIDALAKAYRAAGDDAQKASLAKAIFGRGGLANGPILGAVADAGGIDALVAKLGGLNIVTKEQNDEWARMSAQIEETNKRAKNILAAIFTQQGLEAALAAAQYTERMARAAAELARQREGLSWFQKLMADMAANEISAAGGDSSIIERATAQLAAIQRIGQGKGDNLGVDKKSLDSWTLLSDGFRRVESSAEVAAKSVKELQDAAARESKEQQERISLLGSAATADERLIARLAQLKSALLDNKMAQEDYNRAVAAANIDTQLQKLQLTISALGSAATVTEQYTAKLAALNAQRDKGEITPETYLRGVAGLANDEQLRKLQDTANALGDLITPAEQYVLEVERLNQKLHQGAISQDTFNRALQGAVPGFKDLRDATNGFAQSLLSNLLNGQKGFQALTGAASGFIQKMASSNLDRFMKGGSFFGTQDLNSTQGALGMASAGLAGYQSGSPLTGALGGAMAGAAFGPMGAVAGGVIGGVAGLFGQSAQKKEAEKQRQAQLAAIRAQQQQLVNEATGQLTAYAQDPLTDVASKLHDINAAAGVLTQNLTALGQSTDSVATLVAAAVDKLRKDFTDDITKQINSASGKGYLNDIKDAIKLRDQNKADAASLGITDMSQIDRLFSLQSQKIVDGAGLVGGAFKELFVQFPELTGVIKQSSTALDDFSNSINSFLNQLNLGDLSTLSPQDKLGVAQSAYDKQLALAQSGDATAMAGITTTAQDLLTAAKEYFASSAEYAKVFALVSANLSSLPTTIDNATFAFGGRVSGGTQGVDSVPALLMPDEFVVNARAAQQYMPFLEAINSGKAVQHFANGGMVGPSFSRGVAMDSGQHFDSLGKTLSRVMVATATAQINTVKGELSSLRNEVRGLSSTMKTELNRPQRPGNKRAA